MGSSVGVNPPKTPVHKGSRTTAKATIPNVCKMPGPPAPFVPSPLPNIAKSELSPKDYSTTVQIEGNAVAIRGATFESIGDMASKGTGGGLISANCHGPAKFIAPGSMNVKIEGKNVQLLGDQMLNNLGPGGSPPNTGATMKGAEHDDTGGGHLRVIRCEADDSGAPFSKCEQEEICAKCKVLNEKAQKGRLRKRDKSRVNAEKKVDALSSRLKYARDNNQPLPNYGFAVTSNEAPDFCLDKAKAAFANDSRGFQHDHQHDWTLGGHPDAASNLRWMSSRTNRWMGTKMQKFHTKDETIKGKKHKKETGVKCTCCS